MDNNFYNICLNNISINNNINNNNNDNNDNNYNNKEIVNLLILN